MRADSFAGRLVGALARVDEYEDSWIDSGSQDSKAPKNLVGALARTDLINPLTQDRRISEKLPDWMRDLLPNRLRARVWAAETLGMNATVVKFREVLNRDVGQLFSITDGVLDHKDIASGHFDSTFVSRVIRSLITHARDIDVNLPVLAAQATSLIQYSAGGAAYAKPSQTETDSTVALIDIRNNALGLGSDVAGHHSTVKRLYPLMRRIGHYFPEALDIALLRIVLRSISLALAASDGDFSEASLIGLDLSAFDLTEVKVIDAIWSEETRWPPGMENQIRRESLEIRPGIYKIIGPGLRSVATELIPIG